MRKIIYLLIFMTPQLFAQEKLNYNIEYIDIKPNGYFLNPAVNHPYSPCLKYVFGIPDTSNVFLSIIKESNTDTVLFFSRILIPGIYTINWNGKHIDNDMMLEGYYNLNIHAISTSIHNLKSIFNAYTKIILLN